MKSSIILIVISILSISGCGNFHHKQQTFYVKEISVEAEKRPKPLLRAQIVPSTESTVIPLLFHSRKWGAPYSVLLRARSDSTECIYYLLHSLRVKSEDELVSEQNYKKPLKLTHCGRNDGKHYDSTLYRYELGDSLVFEEGKKIELQITYSQHGTAGKTTLLMQGVGEQEQLKAPLHVVYMSI